MIKASNLRVLKGYHTRSLELDNVEEVSGISQSPQEMPHFLNLIGRFEFRDFIVTS
jgi:hypothetical protein